MHALGALLHGALLAHAAAREADKSCDYAMLCAQVLVDRSGCEDNRRLAALGPGALIEVSEVLGRG